MRPGPIPLTPMERAALDFIVDHLRRFTFQPSVREIAAGIGVRSTRTVADLLASLEAKGFVERDGGRSRGVRVRGLDFSGGALSVPVHEGFPGEAPAGSGADEVPPAGSLLLDPAIAGSPGTFLVRMGAPVPTFGVEAGDLLLVEPVDAASLRDGDRVAVRLPGAARFSLQAVVRSGSGILLASPGTERPPIAVEDVSALRLGGRVLGLFRSRLQAAPARGGAVEAPGRTPPSPSQSPAAPR